MGIPYHSTWKTLMIESAWRRAEAGPASIQRPRVFVKAEECCRTLRGER